MLPDYWRGTAYIRRSYRAPKKPPIRLGGWYGPELWLWRGNPQRLTLVHRVGPRGPLATSRLREPLPVEES